MARAAKQVRYLRLAFFQRVCYQDPSLTLSVERNRLCPVHSADFVFTVASTSGGWAAYSDERLKKNRTPISNARAMVRQWTGYTYDRPDMERLDGRMIRQAGLLAQDVRASGLPEAVEETTSKLSAHPGEEGVLAMNYDATIAALVNAYNELDADYVRTVADLTQTLNNLVARVAALEGTS